MSNGGGFFCALDRGPSFSRKTHLFCTPLSREHGGYLSGGRCAAGDALGNADAVVGVAGKGEITVACGELSDARDAREMADVILGHRGRPAGNVGQDWIA